MLQTAMDHWVCFTNRNVGWLGQVHNAHVFRNFGFPDMMELGVHPCCTHHGLGWAGHSSLLTPPLAYEAMHWAAGPQEGVLQSLAKQMAIECAFGYVKMCWRSLGVCLELRLGNIPRFVAATCILHNICKANGGSLPRHQDGSRQTHVREATLDGTWAKVVLLTVMDSSDQGGHV